MKKCCLEGSIQEHWWPTLKPLSPQILDLFMNNRANFSRSSSSYNNILSMAATAVENDNGGGWQQGYRGDHAVTMNGRTHHFFPSSTTVNPRGGLSYFTFDPSIAYEHLHNHGQHINRNGGRGVNADILQQGLPHSSNSQFIF
jgi:hypothetical protein